MGLMWQFVANGTTDPLEWNAFRSYLGQLALRQIRFSECGCLGALNVLSDYDPIRLSSSSFIIKVSMLECYIMNMKRLDHGR